MPRSRNAVLAALLMLGAWSGPARAQHETLSRLSYTLGVGPMFPAGEEGAGLENGLHVVGSLGYELNPNLYLGGDLAYTSSDDPLHTRFLTAGGHIRMSPSPDLELFYVRIGLGLYAISYHPDAGGPAAPRDRIRPGGSIGAGFEVLSASRLGVGVNGAYHGLIAGRKDAVGFVTVGVYVTWRPHAAL